MTTDDEDSTQPGTPPPANPANRDLLRHLADLVVTLTAVQQQLRAIMVAVWASPQPADDQEIGQQLEEYFRDAADRCAHSMRAQT
jgi:hypothetical protein